MITVLLSRVVLLDPYAGTTQSDVGWMYCIPFWRQTKSLND